MFTTRPDVRKLEVANDVLATITSLMAGSVAGRHDGVDR